VSVENTRAFHDVILMLEQVDMSDLSRPRMLQLSCHSQEQIRESGVPEETLMKDGLGNWKVSGSERKIELMPLAETHLR
jgi:hypothetical protein